MRLHPNNVPSYAERVEYHCDRHIGIYYVWMYLGKWFWVAQGNQGEAPTREQAAYAAKEWIRNG